MKNNSQGFIINQLLVCLVVSICFGGSVGLGMVWMRHQISVTANSNRKLAARIAELERNIAETKTVVESEQSPDKLRQLNAAFRLGLVPKSEAQVMRIPEDPVRRMLARANSELFTDRVTPLSAAATPISFQLALQR